MAEYSGGNYTLDDLGWSRVPTDIVDKRVTDLMDLTGKRAIVTGAGGVGLGRAIAHRLAGLGAEVTLVGIHDNVIAASEEVAKKWGVKTHYAIGDLTKWDDVMRVFAEANEAMGGIDILVNNANHTVSGNFAEMTEEQIRESIDGPYTSVVFCCRAVAPYMIAQESGRIVNISSESSVRAHNTGLSVYAASKSGVNGLTRQLAYELGLHGILVNSVLPGVMMNPKLQAYFNNPEPWLDPIRESIVVSTRDTLVQRVSISEEVANTVAYLCTDAASYITGQNICNGGGMVVS
ncbi:MAG: SDR family NAD(P)-dependent oxidoreductase [Tractidigestivibacter sp.]|jgi:3-oxoacyl-[acyl-carrier protein] reductase|uniref:SDR family NAD(P)-dependent oxidoreductase n=1 Tax=Tractidigestivibacter sp. TaxID=2847320 RepID=UPI003D913D14